MSKNRDVRKSADAESVELSESNGANIPEAGGEPIAEPVPQSKPALRIYVGPTLIKYGITENTVFRGYELPENVQALADDHPCIRALIVPVTRLSEVQAALNDETSIEFKYLSDARKIN